jgi:hypothetical protein
MEDLFETPELIPFNVLIVLNEITEYSYEVCAELLKKIEPLGFTFDYGLDGEPYNLRRL